MAKTVPNQRDITIQKEVCDKNHLYTAINLSALEAAAQNLKAGAFKLWVYFAKNQDKHNFALSPKDCLTSFGIKEDQYSTAVNELISKKYLVPNGGGNKFIFHEVAVGVKNPNGSQKGPSPQASVPGKTTNEVQIKDAVGAKTTHAVPGKTTYGVVGKNLYASEEKPQRNNTYNNTYNNTVDNTIVPPAHNDQANEGVAPPEGEITKSQLSMCSDYEDLGDGLYRMSTGKIFRLREG